MTVPPPDWYPDPSGTGGLRYWDGQQWTGHLAPGPHHAPYGSAPYGSAPSGSAPYGSAPQGAPAYRAAGPGVATTPDGARLAGWWHRVGATLLDQVLLVLVSLPFSIGVQVSMQDRIQSLLDEFQRRVNENDPGVMSWYFHQLLHLMHPYVWLYVGQALFSLVLYTVCLQRWGGSPGQLIAGLRVRLREPPGNLSWGRAALRVLLYPVLNTLVVAVGLTTGSVVLTFVGGSILAVWSLLDTLWAAWDAKKQTLHDKIVGTNVVRNR